MSNRWASSSPEIIYAEDATPVPSGTLNGSEDHSSDGEDAFGVSQLSEHFAELTAAVGARITELAETAQRSVLQSHRSLEKAEIAEADTQMEALRRVMAQCDELETELLKMRQLGDIAAGFRQRLLALEKSLS